MLHLHDVGRRWGVFGPVGSFDFPTTFAFCKTFKRWLRFSCILLIYPEDSHWTTLCWVPPSLLSFSYSSASSFSRSIMVWPRLCAMLLLVYMLTRLELPLQLCFETVLGDSSRFGYFCPITRDLLTRSPRCVCVPECRCTAAAWVSFSNLLLQAKLPRH